VPAGVGVQKPDVLPTGQTTILAKPTAFAPIFTVLEVSVGGLHEGNERGAPWVLLALPVSHGANDGTSGTRNGDAPIGTVWVAIAASAIAKRAINEPKTSGTPMILLFIFIKRAPPYI